MTSAVTELLAGTIETKGGPQTRQVLTAANPPDLRVSATVAFIGYDAAQVLSIEVENHSPIAVFLASVMVELEDGRNLFPKSDSVTGELNSKRRLEPGDRFDFHLSPSDVLAVLEDPSLMRRAAVRDVIARMYYSDEESFRHQVDLLFGL